MNARKENMSDRYKMFEYEITDEPDFMDEEFGITPEIKELIQGLYYELRSKKRGIVNTLLKAIKKYPQIPLFRQIRSPNSTILKSGIYIRMVCVSIIRSYKKFLIYPVQV